MVARRPCASSTAENGAFEDSLRFLGFKVPRVVRSNYSFTTLSLPSILNFCHLTFLNGSASTELPHYLVAHNRAAATLRMQGYRFVFFPSQYWAATRRNPQADTTFLGEKRWSINRALTSSPLRIRLRNTTPLAFTGLGGPTAMLTTSTIHFRDCGRFRSQGGRLSCSLTC